MQEDAAAWSGWDGCDYQCPAGCDSTHRRGRGLGRSYHQQSNHHSCARYADTGATYSFLKMILYVSLGINKLQFLINKISFFQLFFSSIFGHQNLHPDPYSLEMLDPNPDPGAIALRIYRILIQRSWAILPPINPSQLRKVVHGYWWSHTYSFYKWSGARIFKLLRSPRIDSKESIPLACVAWRAGTTTLFLLGS